MEIIKIKYFADITPIESIAIGDWIDLRAAKDYKIKSGNFELISLGIGMALPAGYEAYVLPRSSTFSRYGIIMTNSMGVIDNSYSGNQDEWHFPAFALRDTIIHKNDRICQFRITQNQPRIKFEMVGHLNNLSRGGLGSTGTD